MVSFSCIQCGSPNARPVFLKCRDYYRNTPYEVDYYRCDGCGLVQQAPIPVETAPFYDHYPVHQRKSALYQLARRVVQAPVYLNLKGWEAGTVLVDYGCGDGWFLEMAKGRGLRLAGFEPQKEHARRLSEQLGVPVYSDYPDMLAEYQGKVDIVTMHFVLEHLTSLNEAFERVARLLRPGGTFFFTVPQVSSFEARVFGKRWHNLDAPRHISFPELCSVSGLAGRWGFTVQKRRAVPFPNGVAGSLAVCLSGTFTMGLFGLFLPLGIVLSRLFPGATCGYTLVRTGR